MSGKVFEIGTNKKRNERKILQHQNEVQKRVLFHSFSKPETPLWSDKSEFPSLSESVERTSDNTFYTGGALKYSDKLKSPSSSRNPSSIGSSSGNLHFKCDSLNNNIHDQQYNRTIRTKFQRFVSEVESNNISKQNIFLNKGKNHLGKKRELIEPKPAMNAETNVQNISNKSCAFTSDNANLFTKSDNKIQSNKIIKSVGACKSKEETGEAQCSSKSKKKQKRKSKVKRQAALQSGKITFLTPEVHSKILNQANSVAIQNFHSVIGDINDEIEYPELGKQVLPISQKENFLKKNIFSEGEAETIDKSSDSSAEKNVISENDKELSMTITPGNVITEKKEKGDNKVHSHNPITVSFCDMLLERNLKPKKDVKELKSNVDVPNVIGLPKTKIQKNAGHPHNLLDSSSPAVKRGKEREKPRPRKPSQLKKIILLDRKVRQEQLLLMKKIGEEAVIMNENELVSKLHVEEGEASAEKGNKDVYNCENHLLLLSEDEDNEHFLQLSESTNFNVPDEFISEMVHLNLSDQTDYYDNDLFSMPEDAVKEGESVKQSSTNVCENNEDSLIIFQIENRSLMDAEMHLNVPRSPDSLLNNLTKNVKSEISDRERAARILLHTRNFREYCNHLISKDIDDVAFALLDDLARFQDRLHQKDPVKARMKRRMVYGVKEVKKHIKLRKLKCIIIAVDIENVETQGGLNDILNDIKISAVDHHIPCVFALSRKILGKVCRKPVPVSCVGVFNFEGSEANFKKMVELQSQSKADYTDIFNKIVLKLTNEEVGALLKAKKEAPETLCTLRADILSDFFLETEKVKTEDENTDLKSDEQMSNLIDLDT